jgi:dUTP pyrophosphatase
MDEKICLEVQVLEGGKIPTYGSDGASGMDVYARETVAIPGGLTKIVPTGIKVGVPNGYGLFVLPRSGTSLKTAIRVANAPGLVDSDYRGEVGVIVWNSGRETIKIEAGERIAQVTLMPTPKVFIDVVEELSETVRGEGGFGSTGNK